MLLFKISARSLVYYFCPMSVVWAMIKAVKTLKSTLKATETEDLREDAEFMITKIVLPTDIH